MAFKKEHKPLYEHRFGGFTVKVYFNEKKPKNCYATVSTDSVIWHIRLGIANGGYDYLLKSFVAHDLASVETWTHCTYAATSFLGNEREFSEDMVRAINEYVGRMDSKARDLANKVTESDEASAEAEMRDAIAYANMNESEREDRKETMRKELSQIISGESEPSGNESED